MLRRWLLCETTFDSFLDTEKEAIGSTIDSLIEPVQCNSFMYKKVTTVFITTQYPTRQSKRHSTTRYKDFRFRNVTNIIPFFHRIYNPDRRN